MPVKASKRRARASLPQDEEKAEPKASKSRRTSATPTAGRKGGGGGGGGGSDGNGRGRGGKGEENAAAAGSAAERTLKRHRVQVVGYKEEVLAAVRKERERVGKEVALLEKALAEQQLLQRQQQQQQQQRQPSPAPTEPPAAAAGLAAPAEPLLSPQQQQQQQAAPLQEAVAGEAGGSSAELAAGAMLDLLATAGVAHQARATAPKLSVVTTAPDAAAPQQPQAPLPNKQQQLHLRATLPPAPPTEAEAAHAAPPPPPAAAAAAPPAPLLPRIVHKPVAVHWGAPHSPAASIAAAGRLASPAVSSSESGAAAAAATPMDVEAHMQEVLSAAAAPALAAEASEAERAAAAAAAQLAQPQPAPQPEAPVTAAPPLLAPQPPEQPLHPPNGTAHHAADVAHVAAPPSLAYQPVPMDVSAAAAQPAALKAMPAGVAAPVKAELQEAAAAAAAAAPQPLPAAAAPPATAEAALTPLALPPAAAAAPAASVPLQSPASAQQAHAAAVGAPPAAEGAAAMAPAGAAGAAAAPGHAALGGAPAAAAAAAPAAEPQVKVEQDGSAEPRRGVKHVELTPSVGFGALVVKQHLHVQALQRAERARTAPKLTAYEQHQLLETCVHRARVLQEQLRRSLEGRAPPPRVDRRRRSHHDYLLHEMRLMATDFHEEGKWRRAAAALAARDVAAAAAAAELAPGDAGISRAARATLAHCARSLAAADRPGGGEGRAAAIEVEENGDDAAALPAALRAVVAQWAAVRDAAHAGAAPPLRCAAQRPGSLPNGAVVPLPLSAAHQPGCNGSADAALAATAYEARCHAAHALHPDQVRALRWAAALAGAGAGGVLAGPPCGGKTAAAAAAVALADMDAEQEGGPDAAAAPQLVLAPARSLMRWWCELRRARPCLRIRTWDRCRELAAATAPAAEAGAAAAAAAAPAAAAGAAAEASPSGSQPAAAALDGVAAAANAAAPNAAPSAPLLAASSSPGAAAMGAGNAVAGADMMDTSDGVGSAATAGPAALPAAAAAAPEAAAAGTAADSGGAAAVHADVVLCCLERLAGEAEALAGVRWRQVVLDCPGDDAHGDDGQSETRLPVAAAEGADCAALAARAAAAAPRRLAVLRSRAPSACSVRRQAGIVAFAAPSVYPLLEQAAAAAAAAAAPALAAVISALTLQHGCRAPAPARWSGGAAPWREIAVKCATPPAQARAYARVASAPATAAALGNDGGGAAVAILGVLQRACLCAPADVSSAVDPAASAADGLTAAEALAAQLEARSGKLVPLAAALRRLRAGGKRALVVAQQPEALSLARAYLRAAGVPFHCAPPPPPPLRALNGEAEGRGEAHVALQSAVWRHACDARRRPLLVSAAQLVRLAGGGGVRLGDVDAVVMLDEALASWFIAEESKPPPWLCGALGLRQRSAEGITLVRLVLQDSIEAFLSDAAGALDGRTLRELLHGGGGGGGSSDAAAAAVVGPSAALNVNISKATLSAVAAQLAAAVSAGGGAAAEEVALAGTKRKADGEPAADGAAAAAEHSGRGKAAGLLSAPLSPPLQSAAGTAAAAAEAAAINPVVAAQALTHDTSEAALFAALAAERVPPPPALLLHEAPNADGDAAAAAMANATLAFKQRVSELRAIGVACEPLLQCMLPPPPPRGGARDAAARPAYLGDAASAFGRLGATLSLIARPASQRSHKAKDHKKRKGGAPPPPLSKADHHATRRRSALGTFGGGSGAPRRLVDAAEEWTPAEDARLIRAVEAFGGTSWALAAFALNRDPALRGRLRGAAAVQRRYAELAGGGPAMAAMAAAAGGGAHHHHHADLAVAAAVPPRPPGGEIIMERLLHMPAGVEVLLVPRQIVGAAGGAALPQAASAARKVQRKRLAELFAAYQKQPPEEELPADDPQVTVALAHASHAHAVEALGISLQAPSLTPEIVIDQQARRQDALAARAAAAAAAAHHASAPIAAAAAAQQQQHHHQQVAGSPPPAPQAVGSPAGGQHARGKVLLAGRSIAPNRAAAAAPGGAAAAGGGGGRGAPLSPRSMQAITTAMSGHSGESQQMLMSAIQRRPEAARAIRAILQRADYTQAQKVHAVAQVISDAKAAGGGDGGGSAGT